VSRLASAIRKNVDLRYDVKDLDGWLDSLKEGKSSDADEIIGRLK
jgi:hypothetical protein